METDTNSLLITKSVNTGLLSMLVPVSNFDSQKPVKGQFFYEIDLDSGNLTHEIIFTNDPYGKTGDNVLSSDNKRIVDSGYLVTVESDYTLVFTINAEENTVDWWYAPVEHSIDGIYNLAISKQDVIIFQIPDLSRKTVLTGGIKIGDSSTTWEIHTTYNFFFVLDAEDFLWSLEGNATAGWSIVRRNASSGMDNADISLKRNLFTDYFSENQNFLAVANHGNSKNTAFLVFRSLETKDWFLSAYGIKGGELWENKLPAGSDYSEGCNYPAINDDGTIIAVICRLNNYSETSYLSIFDTTTGNPIVGKFLVNDNSCKLHFLTSNSRIVLICFQNLYVYDIQKKIITITKKIPSGDFLSPVLDSSDNIYFYGNIPDHSYSFYAATKISLK